jgi:choice-of-anchor A domain-containing protein
MFSFSTKKIAILFSVLASTTANAGPLSNYNLILNDDFNVSGGSGHVEGKTFIGGNLVNGSIFAQHIHKSSTENTVEVVGNVTGNSGMRVEAGYLAYSGTTNVNSSWSGICNGNGLSNNDACFRKMNGPELSNKKASIFQRLENESTYFKNLASSANTAITGDSNNKTFQYTGTATDLAVFNISALDLANINWGVNFGTAVNILINVEGSSFNAGNAHVNGFQNHSNNVLWNFYNATSLNFGDSWYGSILALNAVINTSANLNGAIAAKTYIGNGEIHDFHWDYDVPDTELPEPTTLMLALFGLGFIALTRLRRRPQQ